MTCAVWRLWVVGLNRSRGIRIDHVVVVVATQVLPSCEGLVGERATMFFRDPASNAPEFKSFRNPDQLFAK